MAAASAFSPWLWVAFVVLVLFFLALDLGVIHRRAQPPSFRASLGWSLLWFLFAMSVAGALALGSGAEAGLQFLAGYVVEYLAFPGQHFCHGPHFRLVPRGSRSATSGLVLGRLGRAPHARPDDWRWGRIAAAIPLDLLRHGRVSFCTGLRWACTKQAPVQPERNLMVRLVRKLFPVTRDFEGRNFFGRVEGRRALTPLALALLTIEATDLVFATTPSPRFLP